MGGCVRHRREYHWQVSKTPQDGEEVSEPQPALVPRAWLTMQPTAFTIIDCNLLYNYRALSLTVSWKKGFKGQPNACSVGNGS